MPDSPPHPPSKTRKKRTAASPPTSDRVTEYARRVLDGAIVAGPLVRAACARHIRDLETAAARGWFWDAEKRDFALDFFPNALCLAGGDFEGRPFELGDWQAFIVGSLFGWVDAHGYRRFQSAYLEIGKGNGKSPLAAGIGLFMLGPDGEARAEVYAAASKKDQAMILFRDAVAMVDQSPALSSKIVKSGVGAQTWNLAYPPRGSWFRAIASDDGQSGPRPHCALLDEVHEHQNDLMVEAMRAGFKGRRQPLMVMITNSGFDRNSVCWAQHRYGERIVKGVQEDDRYFAYICALDEGEDPLEDESCWIKANPNLGVSIQPDYLRSQVLQARGMPSKQSKVKRLNFCMWVEAANPWISREIWEACEDVFDPEEELQGEECVGGLDLSGTRDLTALALYFPHRKTGFVEFWTPEETLAEREQSDQVPYAYWVQEGFLHATPGRNVDYRKVAQRIAELQLVFGIRTIAFDPYRIKYMESALEEEGVTVSLTPHGQGFYRAAESKLWMPRSIELLEKLVSERVVRIQKNPVLSWNAFAAVQERDNKENRIFAKRKSNGRIDGLVALTMAVGASEAEGEKVAVPDLLFF